MTRQPDTTTLEARRQARAVQRITGEWWCQSGSHYTKAKQAISSSRRTICEPCKARLAERTKQAQR